MYLYIIVVLLQFSRALSEEKSFYSWEMCNSEFPRSCTFQLGETQNSSCYVYNSADFGYPQISNGTSIPTDPVDAHYRVSLEPYLGKYIPQQYRLISAINITFETENKDIEGFEFCFSSSHSKWNMCWYINYKLNLPSEEHKKITLFYDCIHSLPEQHDTQYFQLVTRSIPQNEELSYIVYIPTASSIESTEICFWSPVMMISTHALDRNMVEVTFSQFYSRALGSYTVSLFQYPKNSEVFSKLVGETIYSSNRKKWIKVVFEDIDAGQYYINVQPMFVKMRCEGTNSDVFAITSKLFNKMLILYIILMAILATALIVFVWKYLSKLFKIESARQWTSALYVYSFDSYIHEEVTKTLENISRRVIKSVSDIYEESTDCPNSSTWLSMQIQNSDIIVIVISDGVFHKIQEKNGPIRMPESDKHALGDRLTPAVRLLEQYISNPELWMQANSSKDSNICPKKVIRIYFSYSGTKHIPDVMKSPAWGDIFELPKDFNKFLCCLNGHSGLLCTLGIHGQNHNLADEYKCLEKMVETANKCKNEDVSVSRTIGLSNFYVSRESTVHDITKPLISFENSISQSDDKEKCIDNCVKDESEECIYTSIYEPDDLSFKQNESNMEFHLDFDQILADAHDETEEESFTNHTEKWRCQL